MTGPATASTPLACSDRPRRGCTCGTRTRRATPTSHTRWAPPNGCRLRDDSPPPFRPIPKQGSIAGVVTEKGTGTPLSALSVEVVDYEAGSAFHVATETAADGSYVVEGLDAGEYDVFVHDDTETYVDGAAHDVQVDADATTTVDFEQPSWAVVNRGSIAGVVSEKGTGTPLQGISIQVTPKGMYFPKFGSTAADGSYEVSGLDPGTYSVLFEDNARVYVDKGTNNVVVEPATTTNLDMELVSWATANAGSISGVVRAADTGTPIPGVSITVYLPGSVLERTRSAADGSYEVDDLPPGSYGIDFALMNDLYTPGSVSGVVVDRNDVTRDLELSLKQGPIDVAALVAMYGPELRLHPGEQFFMADPADVLDGSYLTYGWVYDAGSYAKERFVAVGSRATSAATLMADVAAVLPAIANPPSADAVARYFIQIPSSLQGGDQSGAVAQVRVLPMGDYLDLQYWFFYPFNGHGWSKWRFGEIKKGTIPSENSTSDTQIGRHWGDWEHVTVRLVADTLELDSVYLSRHSGGKWYEPDELGFVDGTHPIVYSGKFTHANYEAPGQRWYGRPKSIDFKLGHIDIDLVDYARDGGVTFQTWLPGATKIVSSALPGFDVDEPEWLQYEKGWGQTIKNHLKVVLRISYLFGHYDIKLWDDSEINGGPSGPARKTAWSAGDVNAPPCPPDVCKP